VRWREGGDCDEVAGANGDARACIIILGRTSVVTLHAWNCRGMLHESVSVPIVVAQLLATSRELVLGRRGCQRQGTGQPAVVRSTLQYHVLLPQTIDSRRAKAGARVEHQTMNTKK